MSYLDLFENLSMETINDCDAFVHPDIHFKDPFNDFRGIQPFKTMLKATLHDVKDLRFTIVDQACSESGRHYVRWEFYGTVKILGPWNITGMSELLYDDQKRVIEHIDFWDASEYFYDRLPVIRWPLNLIKSQLRVM